MKQTYKLIFIALLLLGLCVSGAQAVSYTSHYPPGNDSNVVKATTNFDVTLLPQFTTDPSKSLTGTITNNQWVASTNIEQAFNIDLGSQFQIDRIYYENSHNSGLYSNVGANNFTLYGSNDNSNFQNTDYANLTGWTQINTVGANSTGWNYFIQHVAADTTDPQYIYLNNSASYRYYSFRFANNYGNADMGVRRIELQTLQYGYSTPWTQINASAGWDARDEFITEILNNGDIIGTGGYNGAFFNDTWRTTNDGITWSKINPSSGWTARADHRLLKTSNNNLVLIAGFDGTYKNDAWITHDEGFSWAIQNASCGFSPRAAYGAAILQNGHIVITGGATSASTNANDTWVSFDEGAHWILQNSSSGWIARTGHTLSAMVDGSLILTGGTNGAGAIYGDTWRSTDEGIHWTQMTASAEWPARYAHAAAPMSDNSLVIMGGVTTPGTDTNSVWRTTDGSAHWTEINASAGWVARNNFGLISSPSGNISVMGGYSYAAAGYKNDVWELNALKIQTPVASFKTNVTSGDPTLAVNIYDTSYYAPTSWKWAAKNVAGNNTWIELGTTNPLQVSLGTGNWSLNVTAINSAGSNISTQVTFVVVTGPLSPTVSFTATPTNGVNPLTVTFNDTTTSGSAITSYNASFGDGSWKNDTTFPATNISHLYSTAGNYTVTWYVTNAQGTGSASTIITVWGAVHSAFSLFNAAGTAPHTTYLYDTSTNLTPGPVTYLTDFGDGNTSEEVNVFYTWNITGEYNVTHTVSNGLSSETSFMNVTVGTPTPPVVAPVASFYGGPQTGNVPLTVFFTDVSSNTPTSWFWEFGDGSNSTLQNPNHTYTRSGFKNVSLTATNTAGSNITVRSKFVKVS